MSDPATDAVMTSTHSMYLAGAFCTLSFVAALLFLRFYRRTRDPLLLLFAVSFFLQGCPRVMMLLAHERIDDPRAVPAYFLRFVAYALIIFAIVQKNWSRRARPPRPFEPGDIHAR